MRTATCLACVSLLSLLSACGTPSDGYYDANGNYIPYNRYNRENHDHAPLPGGTDESYDEDYHAPVTTTVTTTTYHYDRRGYYNNEGAYIGTEGSFTVPEDMFPPRGMCRVWFTDRLPSEEPPVESCSGIRYRVPAGAYVIYGG